MDANGRRIGMCAAISLVTIVVVYILIGLIGVVERPPNSGTLRQVDPYLAILEYLIILAAVALVMMISAVYAYAPPEGKIYGRAALSFIIVFATLTCSLHFVALTAGRHLDSNVDPQLLRQLSFETEWPNLALAVELLAWDFFFGLAMLFAARVFRGGRLQNYVRGSMTVSVDSLSYSRARPGYWGDANFVAWNRRIRICASIGVRLARSSFRSDTRRGAAGRRSPNTG
jgi:hypothetical protein